MVRFLALFLSLLVAVVGYAAEPIELTVAEAESMALCNNKQLNEVRAAVIEGNWDYRAFLSGWLPQVSWVWFAARSQRTFLLTKLTGTPNQRSFFSNGFNVGQALFVPELFFGTCVGKLKTDLLQLGLLAAVNDVIFAVRAAYYLILVDEEEVVARREHINLLTQSMQEEERRYKVGEATLFQLNETKVAVANALPGYYQALKALKNDRDKFVELLGMDPDFVDCVRLAEREIPLLTVPILAQRLSCAGCVPTPVAECPPPDELFEILNRGEIPGEDWMGQCTNKIFSTEEIAAWEQLALCYRPDVLLEWKKVQTKAAEVVLENGKRLPAVNGLIQWAKPGIGRLSPGTPTNGPFQGVYSWGLFLDVQWDLYDGFHRIRKVRAAKYAKCAAQFAYQKSVQDAKVTVRANFYQMEEALNSYIAAHESVLLAEQAIQQAKHQLNAGVITTLDYREVVDNLLTARTIENYARYSLLMSYYALLHATGMETSGCCCNYRP